MNKKIIAICVVVLVLSAGAALIFGGYFNRATSGTDFTSADLQNMTWNDVLAKARGQTVNWYLWGGDPNTNNFIDNQISQEAANYGITINRVPLTDITLAINKVAGEKQAGKNTGGSVDLVWINGANFMTMQQGNLLFGPGLARYRTPFWSTGVTHPFRRYGLPSQRL